MRDEEAREITGWRYGPPYDFYNPVSDPDDLAELLDPRRREDAYFSAFDERGALVGFFRFERDGSIVEVGPDLTGTGLGLGFLLAGLELARRRFVPSGFRLSVATFNERAIKVYERAGFRRGEVSVRKAEGSADRFLLMEKGAEA